MDVDEEQKRKEVEELSRAVARKLTPEIQEELITGLFIMALLYGMKMGEKILENMSPEEKEELRKKLSP